jgi:hypothetical protein
MIPPAPAWNCWLSILSGAALLPLLHLSYRNAPEAMVLGVSNLGSALLASILTASVAWGLVRQSNNNGVKDPRFWSEIAGWSLAAVAALLFFIPTIFHAAHTLTLLLSTSGFALSISHSPKTSATRLQTIIGGLTATFLGIGLFHPEPWQWHWVVLMAAGGALAAASLSGGRQGLLLAGLGIAAIGWSSAHIGRTPLTVSTEGNLALISPKLSHRLDRMWAVGDTVWVADEFWVYAGRKGEDLHAMERWIGLPASYQTGDVILLGSRTFDCIRPHRAAPSITPHLTENWRPLPFPTARQIAIRRPWRSHNPESQAGEFLLQQSGKPLILRGFASDRHIRVRWSETANYVAIQAWDIPGMWLLRIGVALALIGGTLEVFRKTPAES